MSNLQAKPQPDAITYGPDALEMLPRFTRASYRTATGVQAPPPNPLAPMKRWSIPTATESMTLGYWEFPVNGAPLYVQKTYTPTELKAVNLPGTFEYPKYVIAPSGAYTLQGPDLQPAGIGEDWLSTRSQAEAMADALRALGWSVTGITENTLSGIFTIQYRPEETRRVWELEVGNGGGSRNVGKLVEERNKAGVGAPGKWTTPGESSSPIWHSLVPQSGDLLAGEVPIPQRELYPNEKWVQNLFSGWQIARTDKEQPGSGTSTGSGINPADIAAILANTETIKQTVGKIYATIGGNI